MGVIIENKRMAKSCQTVGWTTSRECAADFAGKLSGLADILRNRNPALRTVPAMTNPTEVPEGPNLTIAKIVRLPVLLRLAACERSPKSLGLLTAAFSGQLRVVVGSVGCRRAAARSYDELARRGRAGPPALPIVSRAFLSRGPRQPKLCLRCRLRSVEGTTILPIFPIRLSDGEV
jgi:hypothetical protein